MSAPIGGQAVLEGVMMRGPSNWAVAVRKPNGQIAEVCRPIESVMKRHWAFRLPIVRGVVALGESLAIGFRALSISANYAAADENEEAETELSRGAIIFAFLIAIGFAISLFKVGPGAARRPAADLERHLVRPGRGRDPGVGLRRLPDPDLAAARPAACLPVPRRRAQGDQRLRGRRGADADHRPALQPDPPALRHGLPALGDGDRDLRLRLLRAAGLVLADREPDPACCR